MMYSNKVGGGLPAYVCLFLWYQRLPEGLKSVEPPWLEQQRWSHELYFKGMCSTECRIQISNDLCPHMFEIHW